MWYHGFIHKFGLSSLCTDSSNNNLPLGFYHPSIFKNLKSLHAFYNSLDKQNDKVFIKLNTYML